MAGHGIDPHLMGKKQEGDAFGDGWLATKPMRRPKEKGPMLQGDDART
jgi:hypothetical protein